MNDNVLPETVYSIEQTSNGYLLIVTEFEATEKYGVVGSSEREHFESVRDLLSTLSSILEPGSRHDAARTYVIEAPGDKHETFTAEHAKIIFGD